MDTRPFSDKGGKIDLIVNRYQLIFITLSDKMSPQMLYLLRPNLNQLSLNSLFTIGVLDKLLNKLHLIFKVWLEVITKF